MHLSDVSKYYDDTMMYEAYTGEAVGYCQFSSFNDSNALGSTSTRRTLSVAPDVVIPTRRALTILGEVWIVGDGTADSWQGVPVRQSFNMRKATDLSIVRSPSQACGGFGGTPMYTSKAWFKDYQDQNQGSSVDVSWSVFAASTETIPDGSIFVNPDGTRLMAKANFVPLADLQTIRADSVDAPVAVTFGNSVYDPEQDAYVSGSNAAQGFFVDPGKLRLPLGISAGKAEPGDLALIVGQGFRPIAGQSLTVSSVAWKILSVQVFLDAYLLQVRRA